MTRRTTYLVIGILCALSLATYFGVRMTYHTEARDLASFARAYARANDVERESMSETYLERYPASSLVAALDTAFSYKACHSEAHPLGRALYKKNPNFTEGIRQCGRACTFGCFHGVMMEMFGTESDTFGGTLEDETPEEYLAHMRDMARDLCTKPEVQSEVRARYCYHGLGHVFQSMQKDLSQALDSCHMWSSVAAEGSCATGVFMEYLFASSSSAILNTKGPEPCNAFPRDEYWCCHFKAYGWITAWGGDVQSALRACDALGDGTLPCIRYTAEAQAALARITSDEDIDALCGALTGEKRAECVKGVMIRTYDLNAGEDAVRSCDQIPGRYHQQCLDDVRDYSIKSADD